MTKTLVGLVVSMTSTAALLGWIDPNGSRTRTEIPPENMKAQVRAAVLGGMSIRPELWNGVEVVAALADSKNERFLTANPADSGSHFQLDADGNVTRLPRWSQQRSAMGADRGTIQIRIIMPEGQEQVSDRQRLALNALMDELKTPCRRLAEAPRPHRATTQTAERPPGRGTVRHQ